MVLPLEVVESSVVAVPRWLVLFFSGGSAATAWTASFCTAWFLVLHGRPRMTAWAASLCTAWFLVLRVRPRMG